MEFLFASALAEEADAVAETVEAAAETAEKAAPGWLQQLVSKFSETPLTAWIAIGVIITLGIILLVIGKSAKKWTAKMIAFGALAISLSFVLSCFRLYRMPQGGSVTPASMLPLMLFAAAYGVAPGLLAGLAYGVLQYLQGGWFLNVWQFSLDYLLAFAALGLAGLAPHMEKAHFFDKLPENWRRGILMAVFTSLLMQAYQSLSGVAFAWGALAAAIAIAAVLTVLLESLQHHELYIAMMIAALGRALSATLAGVVFWESAPWASLIYNGTYLVPDTIICMILAAFIAKPIMRVMRAK